MLTCRTLDENDFQSIKHLWSEKKTLFKSPIDEEYLLKLESKLNKTLLGEEKSKVTFYGVFENEQLIATWGVYRWVALPYYSISELVIDNPAKSTRLYKNVINLLLGEIFPAMENEGRYQFFILAYLRPYQEEALRQGKIWEIPEDLTPYHRYHVQLEAVVPAHTEPVHAYWDMMGKKTWPQPLWIRRGVLKDEYLIPAFLQKLDK